MKGMGVEVVAVGLRAPILESPGDWAASSNPLAITKEKRTETFHQLMGVWCFFIEACSDSPVGPYKIIGLRGRKIYDRYASHS